MATGSVEQSAATQSVSWTPASQSNYIIQELNIYKSGNVLNIFLNVQVTTRSGSWVTIGTLDNVTLVNHYETCIAGYNHNNEPIALHVWENGQMGLAFGGQSNNRYVGVISMLLA